MKRVGLITALRYTGPFRDQDILMFETIWWLLLGGRSLADVAPIFEGYYSPRALYSSRIGLMYYQTREGTIWLDDTGEHRVQAARKRLWSKSQVGNF